MEIFYERAFNTKDPEQAFYKEIILNHLPYSKFVKILEIDEFIINRSTLSKEDWDTFVWYMSMYEREFGIKIFNFNHPKLNPHYSHIGFTITTTNLKNESWKVFLIHIALNACWKGYKQLPSILHYIGSIYC